MNFEYLLESLLEKSLELENFIIICVFIALILKLYKQEYKQEYIVALFMAIFFYGVISNRIIEERVVILCLSFSILGIFHEMEDKYRMIIFFSVALALISTAFYTKPDLLQALMTTSLVFVTSVYALLIYMSIENARKHEKNRLLRENERREYEMHLEMRRKNEEIDQLRNLLFTELGYNLSHIGCLLSEIREFKEIYEGGSIAHPLSKFYPARDIIYRTIIDKLGILPHTETWAITAIYTFFDLIDTGYNLMREDLTKSIENDTIGVNIEDFIKNLDFLQENILGTIDIIIAWKKYYEDKDLLKFEKKYTKMWKKYEKFYSIRCP